VRFEQVLRQVKTRHVTGLTSTPPRKDDHHPIIGMRLGQVADKIARFCACFR